jgi:hypothetical protein
MVEAREKTFKQNRGFDTPVTHACTSRDTNTVLFSSHHRKPDRSGEFLPMSFESTKPAPVEAHKPSTKPNPDLLNSIWTEARDFGEGVVHGAVEAPVNGVVQLANHVANTHLPELHLVNEKDVDGTIAGKIGSFVGTTADMIGLTVATGGIGGAGAIATGLRLAAVGAVYSGVLTPSADNTKNFFADRATSAAVGALTFGAMGAAAVGLDAVGIFAAPAARSVAASIGYGAITGAAGGVVNAEATATLKEGKVLPSASEFFSDVAAYSVFGGAFGAASYGLQHLGNPLQHITIGNKQLTVYNDSAGNPVRLDGRLPFVDDPNEHIDWTSMKSQDGSWVTKAKPKFDTDVIPPEIDSVVKSQEGVDAKNAADAAEAARVADVVVQNTNNSGSRTFDYTGRLTKINAPVRDPDVVNRADAYISYGDSGNVSSLTTYTGDNQMNFFERGPGKYEARVGDSIYNFDGTIKPVASQAGAKADSLQFTGTNGKSFTFNPNDVSNFEQTAKENMTLSPGQGGAPVVKVDNAGKAQISRTSNSRIPIINGQELEPGQTAAIKPGDTVAIRADVGDTYPIWETQSLAWGKAPDGTPQLQNTPLKPNTAVDVQGVSETPKSNGLSSLELDYDDY